MKKRPPRPGLIGYNFMGKAHSDAWRQVGRFFYMPYDIELPTLCGRNGGALTFWPFYSRKD